MDAENRKLAEGLAGQVKTLKSLAYDIEDEAKEHNRYIDSSLGWNFDSTQNLLSGGVSRVTKLLGTNRGNRRLMCYIVAGVVIFGFLFYHLASRVTSSTSKD